MEVLKFIAVAFSIICIIFFAVVFAIGAVFSIREKIEDSKLRKKWAAEQQEEELQRTIKLFNCEICARRINNCNYFGMPCVHNSNWLCEGPPAPEHNDADVKAPEDWVKITRCKNCISWEDNYCHILKKPIYNPDWFCRSGMKKGDK